MFYKNKLFILIFLFILLFSNQVFAQNFVEDNLDGNQLIPENCTGRAEYCGLSDFLQLLVNVFQLMLGLIGSLALFFFIYGGFTWTFSRGNPQLVQKGKDIIGGSALGIILVLGSWTIINFIIILLTTGDFTDIGQLFGQNWNDLFN